MQEVLGLVLESQDGHRRANFDIGQRSALDARPGVDRVSVRTRLRVADRRQHALLEHGRHRVLKALGLLMDLIPRNPQHVGEEPLDQSMAPDDRLRVLAARVGERDRLVTRARDVSVPLEPADHLVHRRR